MSTYEPLVRCLNVPYRTQRDNEHEPLGTCNVTTLAMGLLSFGVRSRDTVLTVWPAGVARPGTANVTAERNDIAAGIVIAKVGANGKVSIGNANGSVEVVVDVVVDVEVVLGAVVVVVVPGFGTHPSPSATRAVAAPPTRMSAARG